MGWMRADRLDFAPRTTRFQGHRFALKCLSGRRAHTPPFWICDRVRTALVSTSGLYNGLCNCRFPLRVDTWR